MKSILIILLFLATLSAYSYNKKVVETTLRSVAEEIITKHGFSLLSDEIQKEALKEQGAQTEDGDCIDDTCLMDTGKMLAAERLFLIKVSDLGNNNYMFKISHINLETNENISVRSEIYSDDLSNVKELFKFSKKFLSSISSEFKNPKSSKVKRAIPVMLQIIFDIKNDNNANSDKNIKKHILTLKTKYDPVNIYQENKFLGKTPLSLQVKEGINSIIFEKDGYESLKKEIKVIRDLKISHISFKKAMSLEIKTNLMEGTVYINRADAGNLKNGILKKWLKEGDYEIKISANGYETTVKNIKFKKNTMLDFGEIYKKNGPYPIIIKAIVKSQIYIDDKFIGYTPKEVRLEKGDYKLNLYNNIANNKKFKLKIKKPKTFSFNMNSGFNFIDFNFDTLFLYTSFPWQKQNTHILFGLNSRLFIWNWKYFDLDILGGGIYHDFDSGVLYKLHLLELNFKPFNNLKINIAIGPFLGDFIDYDNVSDLYRTFGGLKMKYHKVFAKLWYFNIETAAYYGTKNSEYSYYSKNNDSMDMGWLFSTNLSIGIFY